MDRKNRRGETRPRRTRQDSNQRALKSLKSEVRQQEHIQAERTLALLASAHAHAVGELTRAMDTLARATSTIDQDLRSALRPLVESPLFPVLTKMSRSKGVLKNRSSSDRVLFIPDAVLYYGFAHLPSASDPHGKQHESLPPEPHGDWTNWGAYLFSPGPTAPKGTKISPSQDPLFLEALQVYLEGGRRGIEPSRLLQVLLREQLFGKVWLEIDPDGDLDHQVRALQRWLGQAQRQIYGSQGVRKHANHKPARDTLIYTLTESAGRGDWFIARKLSVSQAVVRKSLQHTRAALKAAGLLPPLSPSREQ